MATFEERVEGLTTLAITGSSTPTQSQLTEFLKDGVIDVTNKWLSIRPEDSHLFIRISSESTSQAGASAPSGKIINVVRESGTNDDWRNCTRVDIGMQSRVTDTSSLHYASAYNPAYIISEEGAVIVFPAPSSGGANSYKIYYINGTPTDQTNNATLTYAHSDIKYFPEDKVYLVVIYAAIKSIEATLSDFSVNEEDVELVQSLTPTLQTLQNDYNSAFLPDRNVDAIRARSQQQQASQ